MNVIVNTTVISNLAAIGQLSLLRRLFGELFLSLEVYHEIQAGLTEGYHFYDGIDAAIAPFASDGWLRLVSITSDEEFRLLSAMPKRLHAGEATSLALAVSRSWLFLTDDQAARQEAKRLGVEVSGTLGCLVLAIERKFCSLSQGNQWLQQMMAWGYRSPVADLESLLQS